MTPNNVRLEHRAHLVERGDARAARLRHLLKRPARFARMRDGRVVHERIKAPELEAHVTMKTRSLVCIVRSSCFYSPIDQRADLAGAADAKSFSLAAPKPLPFGANWRNSPDMNRPEHSPRKSI
jgi:hypothetical protein